MAARAALVDEGLAVVQQVARRLTRRLGGCVPLDDLVGIGNLALLDLLETYDPARASFATYAASRVRWMILDAVRRETHGRAAAARAVAVEAAERFVSAPSDPDGPAEFTTLEQDQASLGGFLAGHAAALAMGCLAARPHLEHTSPEEQLGRAELSALLRETIARLAEPKRTLLERHYFGGDRFDVIAQDLGISKSRASRLHAEAIGELGRTARALACLSPP